MVVLDPTSVPGKRDLVCIFRVKCPDIKEGAEKVAGESSIGTWTGINIPEYMRKLEPTIFEIEKEENLVKISYPGELFEEGNMSQILSSIAGNVFGMKYLKSLRLEDVLFPKKIVRSFKGPQVGLPGIYRWFCVKRPLLGTIVKPKVGLSPKDHAKVAYKSWKGGVDLVKDDENLTDQKFNPFKKRVRAVIEARDLAEKETGEIKEYMPNITAPIEEMKKRADFAIGERCRYVMVDIITCGWSALQEIRNYLEGRRIAIHCHRAGHAAFTRSKRHGISMRVVAKITRLIGGDQLHVGTIYGKMKGDKKEVLSTCDALEEKCFGLKKVLKVASGGLHPGIIPNVLKAMGPKIVIQEGGGIHGHPQGTEAGARAGRQAIEAYLKHTEIKKYALEAQNRELKEALRFWSPKL